MGLVLAVVYVVSWIQQLEVKCGGVWWRQDPR